LSYNVTSDIGQKEELFGVRIKPVYSKKENDYHFIKEKLRMGSTILGNKAIFFSLKH